MVVFCVGGLIYEVRLIHQLKLGDSTSREFRVVSRYNRLVGVSVAYKNCVMDAETSVYMDDSGFF